MAKMKEVWFNLSSDSDGPWYRKEWHIATQDMEGFLKGESYTIFKWTCPDCEHEYKIKGHEPEAQEIINGTFVCVLCVEDAVEEL